MWMDVILIAIAVVPLLAGQRPGKAKEETCAPSVHETQEFVALDA